MTAPPKPTWRISYEGADVSTDLSAMVLSVDYTDNLSPAPPEKDKDGKAKPGDKPEAVSDEIAITVEDRDGRWRSGWWPAKGDHLVVSIGYDNRPLLNCGTFEVDEVTLGGAPDVVSLRAQSTPMSDALRTAQSRAYEATTLADLVSQVADELSLELVGDIEATPIARVTQGQESTLAFLRRLAGEYGYSFAVRPPRLVFYPLQALIGADAVMTVRRKDLVSYRLKSAVAGTYAACVASYFDPATKTLLEVRVDEQFTRAAPADDQGSSAPASIPPRTLATGTTGDDVRGWQQWVGSHGFDAGPVDGIFGPLTRAGTVAFQEANGLAGDGIAGPDTFRVAVEQGYSYVPASNASSSDDAAPQTAGGILRLSERFESAAVAEAKATAALAAANRVLADGTLSLVGEPLLVAGINIDLVTMGRLSGRYQLTKSNHRLSRSGYTTDCEVRGV